jgi:hypothetical protein
MIENQSQLPCRHHGDVINAAMPVWGHAERNLLRLSLRKTNTWQK